VVQEAWRLLDVMLKLLSLKGCTVTIDVLGCQKAIAQQIREQKGHYVLALKDNQPTLATDLDTRFGQALENDFAGMSHSCHETEGRGHGREEYRVVHAVELPRDNPHRREWKDLRTLLAVISRRTRQGEEHWETRYYITSLPAQASRLATTIRKHWSIENSQHWVLDVMFHEAAQRTQERNAGANLAAVRRLAVSLLRQEPTLKRGTKAKRLACALDPHYLLNVLQNAKFDAQALPPNRLNTAWT
jgi:predicted transposase YbfD/YdcC